jgi:hypothetical protein
MSWKKRCIAASPVSGMAMRGEPGGEMEIGAGVGED